MMRDVQVDVAILGGGIIGLTLARELALRSQKVLIIDQQEFGRESSWAGAGIIAPPARLGTLSAYDRLRLESYERFAPLAAILLHETGIDVGYQKTGGVERYVDAGSLKHEQTLWREAGIRFAPCRPESIAHLSTNARTDGVLIEFPDMCQVRNPRLMQALIHYVSKHATMWPNHQVMTIATEPTGVSLSLQNADGQIVRCQCQHLVIATGAWSAELLAKHQLASITLPIKPIRGEILAGVPTSAGPPFIYLEGQRYIVPRPDRLVLIGSTEDDVGFDHQVTEQGEKSLLEFAQTRVPSLVDMTIQHHWAGLRPASPLVGPIIGTVPGHARIWLSTGHYREGVQLSLGSAALLADWLIGKSGFAPLGSFDLDADRTQYRKMFES